MTSWRFAAATDVGFVRAVNEDSIRVGQLMAVVADGMGGHAAGEVASALAVDAVDEAFQADPSEAGLISAFSLANERIIDDALAHPERAGMGTTVVAIALVPSSDGLAPVIVNVGDSRAYQLRDGALNQVTDDHSVAEEWVRQGRLTSEEAAVHPRRHQLTRTLGLDAAVEPDVFYLRDVQIGDRVLLCSDGLSNELSDSEIADLASAPITLSDAVARLVEAANARGGRDNISVILLEFDDVTMPRPAPSSVSSSAPEAAVVFAVNEEAPLPARDDELTTAVPVTGSTPPPPVSPVTSDSSAPLPRSTARHASKAKRRFSWRTILFVALLGSLVGLGIVFLGWYNNTTYYLAPSTTHPQTIVVYQSQPGGLLWYKPKVVLDTGVKMTQLRPSDAAAVKATISVNSISDGILKSFYLHAAWKLAHSPPTTTTTTTTTLGGGG